MLHISNLYLSAGQLLKKASEYLSGKGVGEPFENSELLLARVMGKNRLTFRAFPDLPVNAQQQKEFTVLLERKAAGEPLAYILGRAAFLEHEFIVTPDVLIPRPETEDMVLRACELLKDRENPSVLDLCTGSGCIACSVAARVKNAAVTASDVSPAALETARRNAAMLGVSVKFVLSDIFADISGRFDMIISNSPYIPSGELAGLAPEVRREPTLALDGGPDGMSVVRGIVSRAPEFLKLKGVLLLETASGQRKPVLAMFDRKVWRKTEGISDVNRLDRYISAEL
ncbi:MAG: peptide chain release factor N(5)-glutamine methyltransferase [Elusimicrobiaceae bacterium]